jgi:hypothetical protein
VQLLCPCSPVATAWHGSGCTAVLGAPDYAWGTEGPPPLSAELLCHLLVGAQVVVEVGRAVEPAVAADAAVQPPAAVEQRELTCVVPAAAAAVGQGAAAAVVVAVDRPAAGAVAVRLHLRVELVACVPDAAAGAQQPCAVADLHESVAPAAQTSGPLV